jgi:hypothetical protein
MNVAVFSALFYYQLFILRSSPPEAFNTAKKLIGSVPFLDEGDWAFYDKGRKGKA